MSHILEESLPIAGLAFDQPLLFPVRHLPLDVYEQLLVEDVLDLECGELRGAPLGLVNWHPSHCDDWTWEHIHVIWMKSDTALRLAIFSPDWQHECSKVLRRRRRVIFQLHDLLALLLAIRKPLVLDRAVWEKDLGKYEVVCDPYRLSLSKPLYTLLEEYGQACQEEETCVSGYLSNGYGGVRCHSAARASSSRETLLKHIERRIHTTWNALCAYFARYPQRPLSELPPTPEMVWELVRQEQRDLDEYIERMKSLFAHLTNLEQFFIRDLLSQERGEA